MGWKIIEIDDKCILKTFQSNLIIFKDKKITIPISDIDVLIISDTRLMLSVNAINELVSFGVCIILCNMKKIPFSYILGYKVQKQSYVNFEKQLSWNRDFKDDCWNWILGIKNNNQLDLLENYGIDCSEQRFKLKENDNSMLEANISNFFFKQLYGNNFNRNIDNIINSILDYGYVILTNMVARSLTKKGLNCQISFYHGSIYSDIPLAYDVVEIFRIAIDLFASQIYYKNKLDKKMTLTRDIKSCLLDYISNYKIKINGKYEFINNSIDKVIDWIIKGDYRENIIEYDYEIESINETELKEQI